MRKLVVGTFLTLDGVLQGRMTLPEIGTPAPSFRLPSAAGTEVALGDYRGVKSVVLWFSKGLF